MTLQQKVRVPFARALANQRDDWDLPGVEAALVKLAQTVKDPYDVMTIAITWARRTDARTPAGMNHEQLRTSPATPRTPEPADIRGSLGWCQNHATTARIREDGELTCCWQERLETHHATELEQRKASKPPAAAAAVIKQALDPSRRSASTSPVEEL